MKVWIDLHNSPHPLLFAPVIRRLEALGHQVALTARDHAQTAELARDRWPEVAVLGGPSPPGPAAKAAALAGRVAALRRWAARERPDVAVSHNSYAQICAARLLGIPTVTAMDYEHQPANHLAFRLADRVLLPATLSPARVRRYGASPGKTTAFPGLKEEIYLGDFTFDAGALPRAGVDPDAATTLVVTRPPPDGASYHRFANPLYVAALRVLARQESVCCVALARHPAQRAELARLGLPNLVLPGPAQDARSLMYAADLVLGGGGTMTREAALLGIPTYTAFAGRPCAVDDSLVAAGLLHRLRHPEELARAGPRPHPPVSLSELRARGRAIVEALVAATLDASGRAG